MTSHSQPIVVRTRSEDSAPAPGGEPAKFIPPAWMLSMAKAIVMFIISAAVGAATASWRVRGYCDELESHMRVHDVQIETINKNIDRGFNDVHEDLRDLRKDHSH